MISNAVIALQGEDVPCTSITARRLGQYQDQAPMPLTPSTESCDLYPLDALGSILGQAAKAIADGVQAPPAIAAQSVLAAAALAVQPFANAVRSGSQIPLSLFMLTVAGSGDRKSAVDKHATEPYKQRQRQLQTEYIEDCRQYQNGKEAYELVRKAVIDDSKKYGAEKIAGALNELDPPPAAPKKPTILVQDPTIEGLVKSFHNGQHSQGLFNDEGGSFFGGYSLKSENKLKSIAQLSQFWDGNDIDRTRAGEGESMHIKNPRLSVHLMIQPIVAAAVLSDPELLGQGFLARFLIAAPESIAGTRLYKDVNLEADAAVNAYKERITELLKKDLPLDEDGTLTPRQLPIDPEAMKLWIEAYDLIEKQLRREGQYLDVRATASKMAEQMIRIAGVLTLVENFSAVAINADTMERAARIGDWYLQEALRLSSASSEVTDYQIAEKVMEWLIRKGHSIVTVDLLNKGKVCRLNSAHRYREIIQLLVDYCWLFPANGAFIGGKNTKEAWRLNTNLTAANGGSYAV